MDLSDQYDKLYRYCYFRLRNRETAEDITQETLLRFWESEHYRDTGKAMQYLYTIARNLCIDACRRRRFEIPLEPADLSLEAFDPASRDSSLQERLVTSLAVRAALDTLEETDRELLLLRFVNEVPIQVISGLLGMSRFAVYRRTGRALKQLRLLLKE